MYRNRGIRQYTPAQKRAYYNRMKRAQVYGSGRYYVRPRALPYKAGRPFVSGSGRYKVRRPLANQSKSQSAWSAPQLGATLGGLAGGALGSLAPGIGTAAGGVIGSGLGGLAGNIFKSITGWGDYTIHENSLVYPDTQVPAFGEDCIRVKHREFIAEISGTQAFSVLSVPIQPGLDTSFPWLAAIATNYEQYHINGMIFQFVSTSSDAIASTTDLGLGQVILATDYNAADPPFVNAPQMLGQTFSNSGKPSENILHAVECAPNQVAQKLYYVRSGDAPANTDIRLYDLGIFQIATQGMPADYTGMGQLWVSYDITFCKAVQNNQLGFDLNTDKYTLTGVSSNDSDFFGTSRSLVDGSNLGTTVDADTIYFPSTLQSGYFLIVYSVRGTSTVCVTPTIAVTNCTQLSAWSGTSVADEVSSSNPSVTSTMQIIYLVVRIDDVSATLSMSGGQTPLPSSGADLLITQVNGEVFGNYS